MLLKRDDDDDDDFARNPSSPLSVLCVLSPMSWIWKSLIGIPAKITNANSWTSVPFEYLIDIIILPELPSSRALTDNRPRRTSSWAQTLTNSFASAFDLWELISGYSAVDNEPYPHHHLTYKSRSWWDSEQEKLLSCIKYKSSNKCCLPSNLNSFRWQLHPHQALAYLSATEPTITSNNNNNNRSADGWRRDGPANKVINLFAWSSPINLIEL